jgi:hypothetical protein
VKLFLTLLFACIFVGCGGTSTETEAIAEIERIGGRVGQLNPGQSIDLSYTQVTDSGLEHLKGLTNLEWLDVNKTQITDARLADLEASLPECRIRKW